MLFQSTTFIFIFLPLVMILYYVIPARFRKARNIVLLVLSLVFYTWGEPRNLLILLFSLICNFFIGRDLGRRIAAGRTKSAGKVFRFGIGFDLVIFLFFGYIEFIVTSLNNSFDWSVPNKELGVPAGIGLLFLSLVGYLCDVKNGIVPGETDLLDFGLYVCFFPKLTGGPYISYASFKKQITDRRESLEQVGEGLGRFSVGLAKTVILGSLGKEAFLSVNAAAQSGVSVLTAWYGLIMWAFSVYFAYSGFADMAIGLGRAFGFKLPESFRYPLTAGSITEFWKRWNMTVTGWFRTFLFGPMDKGTVKKSGHAGNILFVWALIGFWYGQSWTYLIGGLVFGILIALERCSYGRTMSRWPVPLRHFYTIFLTFLAGVFFSQTTVKGAIHYYGQLFGAGHAFCDSMALYDLRTGILLLILMILAALPYGGKWKTDLLERTGDAGRIAGVIGYAALFILSVSFLL